jgi:hypothetical protein
MGTFWSKKSLLINSKSLTLSAFLWKGFEENNLSSIWTEDWGASLSVLGTTSNLSVFEHLNVYIRAI